MKIVTFANRRGGVGKSTCAAHLAVEAANDGYKVILIDLDPQQTLEGWWNKRQKDDIHFMDAKSSNIIDIVSRLVDHGFDLCIIDTPSETSISSKAGIGVADLVLIPSKPNANDLSAMGRTISTVDDAEKNFIFIITQGIDNIDASFKVYSVLSDFGRVAPVVMTKRSSYVRAMERGDSASSEDKKAAEEFSKIWGFVKENLFEIESSNHKKKLTV